MALANLSLFIPSIEEELNTVSNINERVQQLQKILQELPPELDNKGHHTRKFFRSPLSRRKSPKSHKTAHKSPDGKQRNSPSSSGIFSGSPLASWRFKKSKSPDAKHRKSSSQADIKPVKSDKVRKSQYATTAKRAFSFNDESLVKVDGKSTGRGNEPNKKEERDEKSDEKNDRDDNKGQGDTKEPESSDSGGEKKFRRLSCEGYLCVQGTSGQWKKRWCRYDNGILECRYEKEGSVSARINVGYCMPEIQGIEKYRESNNDDLYWCYLESQQAFFCFKVYSPDRVYSFRAEEGNGCKLFVTAIQADLEETLPDELWARKTLAAQEINPLCREQFIIQMNNHQLLLNSLSSSGFLQSYLPITSLNKEKSGVLGMETEDGWREYYFVLFEGSLYYYQDSKSTTPNGFVTLRYATVELDQKSLAQGNFVFHIITPLRKVSCKARHSVALSEWVHSLEISISREKKSSKEKKRSKSNVQLLSRRSSHDILANINQMLVDIHTLEALCKNQTAVDTFTEWLADTKEGMMENFRFYLDNERLKGMSSSIQDGLSPDSIVTKADRMFHKYISEDAEHLLCGIPKKILDAIHLELQQPTATLFREVEKIVYPQVQRSFTTFKQSKDFQRLTKKLTSKTVMDQRDVSAFEPETVQSFMLKPKGSKRTIEIKLSKRSNVITIGRDKSNYVVIEDSRVSRSHARVEYSATQCEYIDLGSSCGSKLNGKNVLRAKLKPGDLIEIGMSVLIFRVRKKRKNSIFQRLGIRK
mmetsp:Transcript_17022/g.23813  ORF Transcript_17022/g.23813 Transcript_17022/m.23813 type:complete len:758 (+) Transcript_17022:55-2328(+)|eukprot:CAMPEP_0184491428 /NCGR_PEP_ID=MMETSP0113_2-20130426/20367_1 /TAXON_ID=91329 /ORGANISM="Norrisiella sphaerica, Strain BC52" /LENGTH=757 /DNA_ID=CAMNT_0026875795 /DNA_START=16 /DNA_END=2289 /DNA_ORIENTATION=-